MILETEKVYLINSYLRGKFTNTSPCILPTVKVHLLTQKKERNVHSYKKVQKEKFQHLTKKE